MYTKDQNDRVFDGMHSGCALPQVKRCDTAFYKLVCPQTCGAAPSTTTTAATTTIATTTATTTTLAATSETSTSGATTKCLLSSGENVLTWDGSLEASNYRWIVNGDDTGTAIGVNTGTYKFRVAENIVDGVAVAFGPLASDGEKSVQYFEPSRMWNEDRTFYSGTFAASFESFEGTRTIDDKNGDTESYDEVAPRAVLRFDTRCGKGYTTTTATTTTTTLRPCTEEETSRNDDFEDCDLSVCFVFSYNCPIVCGTCARP